jgi:hypothetical protein
MPKFSTCFRYDPSLPKEKLLEGAPEGVRIAYLNGILRGLTFDSQWNEENTENRPLETYPLSHKYCEIAREELPEFDRNSSNWDDLKYLVKSGNWYNFYDFVEEVGKSLKKLEEKFAYAQAWLDDFGFDTYRTNVNKLFVEDRIGWCLNAQSELEREIPKSLSTRLTATEARLVDEFDPAREHYHKAVRYAYSRPIDPENAIKEITSAIESVGRVFYPKAQTLGDVAKEMKHQGNWPSALVQMIEKFYGYASSEPAVRHGAPVSSHVAVTDAEFCLHVGAALIRYLLETKNSRKGNPASTT